MAQTVPAPMPNVIPPSPEAQSFMRYGEIPVDVSTGVPDIQVPLYQITSGKLSLPVSITYHSSGIKVSDVASVVGLGWRLSAGGVLTKSVVGKPDNSANYGMFNYPYLTKGQIDALPQDGSQFMELKMVADGTMDGESDKYYYSAGSKLSGEFIYDHSLNIVQAEYTDNKIIGLYPLSYETGPSAYEVISADGTKYYYEACEYSQTDMDPHYISSWWLTRIVSADNADQISFEYQTLNTPTVVFTQSQSLTFDGLSSPVSYGGSQTNTSSLLLKKITFKNGYVTFDYLNGRKDLQDNRLSVVSIYSNASASPLKKYQFSQSYFYSGTGDNKYNYRLKLDQLAVYDVLANNVENYSFEYDQQYPMPPYTQPGQYNNTPFAYAQDYYGYSNGVNNNQHLITGFTAQAWVSPADRTSNFDFAKTCILTKINYPTGGSTSFEYASNEGASQYGQFPGAGLRVHRIISKTDANTIAKIKRYEYANNLLRADLDLDVAGQNSYDWEPMVFSPANCGLSVIANYTTYLTSPFLPFASFHGNQVVYQNVDEYDDDPVSNINLKKSYVYGASNDQIIGVTSPRYHNQYFVDCSWKKGQLLGVLYYKYDSSAGYILKRVQSNTYSDFRDNTVIAGTKVERVHPKIGGCNPDQYQNGTYSQLFTWFDIPIEVGTRKLTKVETTDFDDNNNPIGTTTTSSSFNSLNHLFPTAQTSTTSKGETRRTEFTYPTDYSGVAVYDQMTLRNLISPVIEKRTYKVNVNNVSTLLETTKTNYGFWDGTASGWTNSITDLIVPTSVEYQKANYSSEPRVIFNNYDSKGNMQCLSQSMGAPVCYLYGYGGSYPIAKISNVDYSTVQSVLGGQSAINNFRDNSTPTDAAVSSFLAPLRALPNAQITSYTYIPLVGMTSMTDAMGKTIYYEYDSFQRLTTVRDLNGKILKHMDYHYKQ
ncbi:YD repeat-containing protein [Mucilaginibacter yixingensis]|uniref:YD repeat-containing protein n=2 Tax=Mucilaginibacter yixingensis TaxID=1295612 RepID=A0A2T5J4M9_9SPHI|nr:YD repeat-containing protein [Mucilaginibacter yixingensis]